MSPICHWARTALSLASGHGHRQELGGSGGRRAGRARLDSSSRAALLLTALAGRVEQWALIEATRDVVRRQVDVEVLDPLVTLGLAAIDRGWVRVPCDDVRASVVSTALPSQLQLSHVALARLPSTDALARGCHLTHAASGPSREAAELALVTARGLQSAGRPHSARVMLEQAARLSVQTAS